MAEPSKAGDEMKPKTNINIWKYLARTRIAPSIHVRFSFSLNLQEVRTYTHTQITVIPPPAEQHTNKAYILLFSLAAAADSLRAAPARRTEGMTHLCSKLFPVEPEEWK